MSKLAVLVLMVATTAGCDGGAAPGDGAVPARVVSLAPSMPPSDTSKQLPTTYEVIVEYQSMGDRGRCRWSVADDVAVFVDGPAPGYPPDTVDRHDEVICNRQPRTAAELTDRVAQLERSGLDVEVQRDATGRVITVVFGPANGCGADGCGSITFDYLPG